MTNEIESQLEITTRKFHSCMEQKERLMASNAALKSDYCILEAQMEKLKHSQILSMDNKFSLQHEVNQGKIMESQLVGQISMLQTKVAEKETMYAELEQRLRETRDAKANTNGELSQLRNEIRMMKQEMDSQRRFHEEQMREWKERNESQEHVIRQQKQELLEMQADMTHLFRDLERAEATAKSEANKSAELLRKWNEMKPSELKNVRKFRPQQQMVQRHLPTSPNSNISSPISLRHSPIIPIPNVDDSLDLIDLYEKKLLQLNQRLDLFNAHLLKLPTHPRTLEQKRKKREIEEDIKINEDHVSKLRLKIKQRKSMLYG